MGQQPITVLMAGILALPFTAGPQAAPTGNRPALGASALLEDVDRLLANLDEVHADPYRATSKEDLLELARRVKTRVPDGAAVSVLESYFALQEIAAAVQDEHTWVEFPHDALPEDELYLPFEIELVEGKLVSKRSLGDIEIPAYAELLEINGVSTKAIWDHSVRFLSPPLPHAKEEFFKKHVYFYLTTLLDLHSPWVVRYASGKERTVTAKGIGIGDLYSKLVGDPQPATYSLRVGDEDIPVLDLPSFAHGRFEMFRAFVDDFFESNRDRRALVVDLRRNTGGNGTWAYYMLDHLTDSPYRIIDSFRFKVSEVFRSSNYRKKAGGGLAKAGDGEYIPIASSHTRTPRAGSNRFAGEVFMLVSRATDSAGVVAAAIFKHAGMGKVIGEETAGRTKFSSDPVAIELPATGLRVSIPVGVYTLPGGRPDRGVVPDVPVERTLDDLRKGGDPVLEALRSRLTPEDPG